MGWNRILNREWKRKLKLPIKWIRHVKNCGLELIHLQKRQIDLVRNRIRGREKGYRR